MRGNPAFSAAALPEAERCWYEELWRVIQDESRNRQVTSRAGSDDLYTYARPLHTHLVALMTAFRLTGDLNLLDEIDRLAQHMRAQLDDSWRGPAFGDPKGIDGYLNWVWGQSAAQYRGRDEHEIDEMRTHAVVAQFAYAFRANADLSSPHGIDYAERAEFWTTYLRDHFEAKWRERNDAPWPTFPFLSRPHMHETVTFIRYHHYMSLLTGEEAYAREAERLTGIVFGNMRTVSTPDGPALVWPRSVLSLGGSLEYLMPTTYGRYVVSDTVDLYLEQVEGWSADVVEKIARMLTEFVIDDGAASFARDIGGGVARAGIPPAPTSWSRFTDDKYVISPYALVGAWDDTGKASAVATEAYAGAGSRLRDVFIPVGKLLELARATGG